MKLLLLLLFSFHLYAKTPDGISIYVSRDLMGNIKPCTCTRVPIAGMGGRAAYLDSERVSLTRDILIETGNYLGSVTPLEKNPAVFESFLAMGYHFLGLSEQEIKQASPGSWEKYVFQPVSSNLQPEKKQSGWKDSDAVYRNGRVIRFLSLLYPSYREKIGEIYLRDWKYIHPDDAVTDILSNNRADLWILSIWGEEKELEESKFFSSIPNKLILLNTLKESPKDVYVSRKHGRVYLQNGINGDEVNVYEYSKDLKFISKRRIVLDAEKLVTPEKISGILSKYGIQ